MPQLIHLQLIRNNLMNTGLEVILNGCLLLESPDLRACIHVHLAGSLGKGSSEQIKTLQRPFDATDDCKFVAIRAYETDYDNYYHGHNGSHFLSNDDDYYEFFDYLKLDAIFLYN
ncbi:hypothetical protein Nepgr_032902 [Nepenthes gracilis]|uniref:Uncharacterized protein n=1 Tax=Nepenthes gracilis TaxID=150966 RepID=A0AAD3TKW9_NEPGR|nr:hypothetical protein Nepgr_032902 [Nepenthes gracilis]